jgi:MYXO-CTERM domain-containing protein
VRPAIRLLVVALAGMASAGRAQAQQRVAFEGASVASGGSTTMNFDHAVGTGSDRYLVVAVAVSPPGVSVSAISYGGQALTAIGTRSGPGCRAELWGLTAPASGAHSVSIKLGGDPRDMVAGATSYTGVDQAAPLGRFASHTGTDNAPVSLETSVAIEAGDYAVDVVCGTGGAPPDTKAGSGQTERWGHGQGTLGAAGSTQPNGSAGRANMAWTLGGSGAIDWTIATAALKPAPVPDAGVDAMVDAQSPDAAVDASADVVDSAPDAEPPIVDAAAEAAPDLGAPDLVAPEGPAPDVAPAEVPPPAQDAGEVHDVRLRVGCACDLGGASEGPGGGWLVLLALVAISARRRCSAPPPPRPRSTRRRWRPTRG